METSKPAARTSGLLTVLLKEVSRSFYLTVRVLPGAIRSQIALAYLLARATDTIADTQILPVWIRLQGLEALRQRILGHSSVPLDFGEFAVGQDEEGEKARKEDFGASSQSPDPLVCPERVLLERIEEGLALLNQFSSADRELLRQVLDTIMSGQALDLTRFASANSLHIKSLETEQELDDYTYRVAGCVGEFWTRLCRARLFPKAQLDDVLLLANAVRFGKGLQLVNLLRDLPKDLREGRCYLPAEALQHFRLTPEALLESANEPAFRPLYHTYLAKCEEHLTAGWAYINALPRRSVRVRLACAWPILIGARTLDRLRSGNVLDAGHRIKIGRAEVRKLVGRSVLCYAWPRAWNRMFWTAGRGRVGPNI